MRLLRFLVPLAVTVSAGAWGQTVSDDPYIWLEEKGSPRAMAWVEAHNAKTVATLEADARYKPFYDVSLAIATAEDRIPMPAFRNGGIFNFWQDGEHLRGLWRRTTLADYRTAEPHWKTVLDVDALGKAEGKSWVWKGSNCLMPDERLCMVSLSDGGEDAVEAREFDLAANGFVKNGFFLPRSQMAFDWEDADHLLVSTDWTGQDLTESGYPYIVKRVTRGQPLATAHELFRGYKSDVGVFPSVLRDGQGNTISLLVRAKDFFHSETFVLSGNTADKLAIPEKASVSALVGGRVIVSLDEDWSVVGTTYKAGSVVALDLAALKKNPGVLTPTLVWEPGPRDALDGIATTRDRLLVSTAAQRQRSRPVFAPQRGRRVVVDASRIARQSRGRRRRRGRQNERDVPHRRRLPHTEHALPCRRRGACRTCRGSNTCRPSSTLRRTWSSSSKRPPPTARISPTSSYTAESSNSTDRRPR